MVQALTTRTAKRPVAGGAAEAPSQYLAFGLGGEAFAMEIRYVKEVLQFEELTPVPLMPAFLRGIINLRGAVVPVIDLSVRFDRPPTEISRRTCIVILELPRAEGITVLGIIVDSVSEVLELSKADIEPAPSCGTHVRAEFIQGVGKVGARFVVLLNIQHLLSGSELAALEGRLGEEVPEP